MDYDKYDQIMAELKSMRQSAGLTQEDLYRKYGIPKRSVNNWENGKRHCPPYVCDYLRIIYEVEREKREEETARRLQMYYRLLLAKSEAQRSAGSNYTAREITEPMLGQNGVPYGAATPTEAGGRDLPDILSDPYKAAFKRVSADREKSGFKFEEGDNGDDEE